MSSTQKDLAYWLAFNALVIVGPVRLAKLRAGFASLAEAWVASARELMAAGIEPPVAEKIAVQRKLTSPEAELEKISRHGVSVVTIADTDYPALLRTTDFPPGLLYYQGSLDCLSNTSIAVVGSRKVTAYGRRVTQELGAGLADHGCTIISGLALGVDAVAHQSAITSGVPTVGVLACGADRIYPSANYRLAKEMIERGGAVLSEFPLGMPALKHHFPQRNRIIAGISKAVVVTQASEKSGALITAQYAIDYHRDVFAVPANIYEPQSTGGNTLIKQGAHLATSITDITEVLALHINPARVKKDSVLLTKTEETVLALLEKIPRHGDDIIRASCLPAATVNAALTVLEMNGLVGHTGRQEFYKI